MNDTNPARFDPEMAAIIDHTLLKPQAQAAALRQLCVEALEAGFASVCVHPIWVPLCAAALAHTQPEGPVVCTVIGFPHGAQPADLKAFETSLAIEQGAREIDMVIPIGALIDDDLATVALHVAAVVKAAGNDGLVKVIIENCYLTDDQKRTACRICADNGAGFVKTSTGFASGGATLDDVRLMRESVGKEIGVKAAGGIRDRKSAREFVRAGATRIGTSSGLLLCQID